MGGGEATRPTRMRSLKHASEREWKAGAFSGGALMRMLLIIQFVNSRYILIAHDEPRVTRMTRTATLYIRPRKFRFSARRSPLSCPIIGLIARELLADDWNGKERILTTLIFPWEVLPVTFWNLSPFVRANLIFRACTTKSGGTQLSLCQSFDYRKEECFVANAWRDDTWNGVIWKNCSRIGITGKYPAALSDIYRGRRHDTIPARSNWTNRIHVSATRAASAQIMQASSDVSVPLSVWIRR